MELAEARDLDPQVRPDCFVSRNPEAQGAQDGAAGKEHRAACSPDGSQRDQENENIRLDALA